MYINSKTFIFALKALAGLNFGKLWSMTLIFEAVVFRCGANVCLYFFVQKAIEKRDFLIFFVNIKSAILELLENWTQHLGR